MSQPPDPQTVSELFLLIARGRAQLEEWIATLGAAKLSAPAKDGWAIKDHLAHLAAWEAGTAALLRGESRYAAMGVDLGKLAPNDFDAINKLIYALHKDESPEQVLNYFHEAHIGLQAELAKLSDDDLTKPYSHFQPNDKRDNSGNPILGWIDGNTYGHYAEHIVWIRENYGVE
jgi:hypothetical protein